MLALASVAECEYDFGKKVRDLTLNYPDKLRENFGPQTLDKSIALCTVLRRTRYCTISMQSERLERRIRFDPLLNRNLEYQVQYSRSASVLEAILALLFLVKHF